MLWVARTVRQELLAMAVVQARVCLAELGFIASQVQPGAPARVQMATGRWWPAAIALCVQLASTMWAAVARLAAGTAQLGQAALVEAVCAALVIPRPSAVAWPWTRMARQCCLVGWDVECVPLSVPRVHVSSLVPALSGCVASV